MGQPGNDRELSLWTSGSEEEAREGASRELVSLKPQGAQSSGKSSEPSGL